MAPFGSPKTNSIAGLVKSIGPAAVLYESMTDQGYQVVPHQRFERACSAINWSTLINRRTIVSDLLLGPRTDKRRRFPLPRNPALIGPSRLDKKLCRSVEVSADSPNMLCPHAARMGDEGKAAGSRIPAALLSLKTQAAHDALKVESAKERK